MDLLDSVSTENILDLVTTQNITFKGSTTYDGASNSFSSLPVVSTYTAPTLDNEFCPKKFTTDNFISKTTGQDVSARHNFTSGISLSTNINDTPVGKLDYLTNVTSDIQTQINTKASTTYVDGAISSLVNTAPSTLDTLNELATALGNDPNFATTMTTLIGTKQDILSNASYLDATSSVQTQLNGKQATLSNASYLDATSSVQTQLNGKQATLSNAAFLDATSSVQTQLNGKHPTITNINTLTGYMVPVDLLNAQTVAGIKTFSSPPVMSGASITSATIPNSALASTYLTTSSAASTYATVSSLSSYLLSSTASSTYATISGLSSYLTTATAASTYQGILSGSSNLSVGTLACTTLTPSALITSSILTENIASVTHSSNVFTLNFATGNCFFGNNPSGNFTVNITNLPTSSSSKLFTITLVVNTGTHYCTSASAADTTPTSIVSASAPKYNGGSAPTVGTSAVVVHSFTIVQAFATKYIVYSVSTFN